MQTSGELKDRLTSRYEISDGLEVKLKVFFIIISLVQLSSSGINHAM